MMAIKKGRRFLMKRLFSVFCIFSLILGLVGCAPSAPQSATVSVMSWNILNPAWGGGPAVLRSESFVKTVNDYLPDVIGLQEASSSWHKEFDALPDNYVAVNALTASGDAAMTTFFVNSDKLTLLDNGIEDLDSGSAIRVVSWAVLEVKDTAVRFLLTNTHPDSRETQCLLHTEKYLAVADRLQQEHDLPMVSVGDFNAIESSAAYQLSISAGRIDCKYADGVELKNDIDSYLLGDYGGKITTGQGSRDHVFVKGDITPVSFETIHTDDTLVVSDHLPVIAEITIG